MDQKRGSAECSTTIEKSHKYIWVFGEDEPYVDLKDCCIDHQSNLFEDQNATKVFKTDEMLYNFLAYDDSYVSTGNDNKPNPR